MLRREIKLAVKNEMEFISVPLFRQQTALFIIRPKQAIQALAST